MGQTRTLAYETSLLAQAELSKLLQFIYLAHVCAEVKLAGEATLEYISVLVFTIIS